MRYMLTFFGVLLLLTLGHAQQQGQVPNVPPYGTPSTFPGTPQQSPEIMPPDQNAPPMSTMQVKEQIQARFNTDPALSNTTLDVTADEGSVIVIGTVDTEKQHNIALRIAQSYAGSRKVVDKISVHQQR